MIAFFKFLTMLVWSIIKLFGSMILCCAVFLFFMWLMSAMPILVMKAWDSGVWAWEEIRAMENSEYGVDT